jgi:hypothetical protein
LQSISQHYELGEKDVIPLYTHQIIAWKGWKGYKNLLFLTGVAEEGQRVWRKPELQHKCSLAQ